MMQLARHEDGDLYVLTEDRVFGPVAARDVLDNRTRQPIATWMARPLGGWPVDFSHDAAWARRQSWEVLADTAAKGLERPAHVWHDAFPVYARPLGPGLLACAATWRGRWAAWAAPHNSWRVVCAFGDLMDRNTASLLWPALAATFRWKGESRPGQEAKATAEGKAR